MCGCDKSGFNGEQIGVVRVKGNVDIRPDTDDITIRLVEEGDDKIFYIGYSPDIAPTANLDVSPTLIEVGQVVTATFSGTYTKGRRNLISKIITPTANVDTSVSPFVFTVPNVSSPLKGIVASNTLTVTDGKNSVSDSASILVKDRYYTGFSPATSLDNINGFTSALGSTIQEAFGGPRPYVVPVSNYIYWLTPDIWDGDMVLNTFPFAVSKIGTINITNIYGLTKTYNVWRSVNYFGTGTLTIDMK